MKPFDYSETEQRFLKVHKILDEFMDSTTAALKVQNQQIKALTNICEILTGQAIEAQDRKIEALKKTCDILAENDQTLQKLVFDIAQDNIGNMKNIERMAVLFKDLIKK